jgi:hypothetical protein
MLTRTVSVDQTTRIHGAITSSTPEQSIWHELSRPQVHGYDLMGAAWLGPWTFASVADEKVARVFEAPRNFVEEVRVLGVKDLAQSQVRIAPCYISGLLRKQRGIDRQRLVCLLSDCRTRLLVMVCYIICGVFGG